MVYMEEGWAQREKGFAKFLLNRKGAVFQWAGKISKPKQTAQDECVLLGTAGGSQ